jgi:AraC-like DNA-binding protein
MMLASIVAEILEHAALAGKLRSRRWRTGDPRIAASLRHLRENLGRDLSVEDLARQSGLGTVRFRQLFQEATGRSPRQFLVRARLTEAASQLRRTSDSIATLAARCGFPTEGHFYATFRREYGVTPRQWRKQGVHAPQQRL